MPRKRRFEFDASNTTADGHYIVGKGRPPESQQFKKNDGRQRGRRPKGTKDLATDFREELGSRVTVTVGGVSKKVSRQRAIVMRLADNATKGQNQAIALALDYQRTLVDPLVQSEGRSKLADCGQDFSRLSVEEIKIMRYITGKLEGKEHSGDVVGVIPVYRHGKYLPEISEAIETGLKAYGIEITEKSFVFPPQCKVIVEAPRAC
jgi:hypothetical protein